MTPSPLDRKTKANEAEPRVIGWFSPGSVLSQN